MVRQDIYVTMTDDKSDKAVTSSSRRGKVKCVLLDVNTDVAGHGKIEICFDKPNKNVEISGKIPETWKVKL